MSYIFFKIRRTRSKCSRKPNYCNSCFVRAWCRTRAGQAGQKDVGTAECNRPYLGFIFFSLSVQAAGSIVEAPFARLQPSAVRTRLNWSMPHLNRKGFWSPALASSIYIRRRRVSCIFFLKSSLDGNAPMTFCISSSARLWF